jgi:hypothetical protein
MNNGGMSGITGVLAGDRYVSVNTSSKETAMEYPKKDWVALRVENVNELIDRISEWRRTAGPDEALCLCCGRYYTEAEMQPGICFHDCPEQRAQGSKI